MPTNGFVQHTTRTGPRFNLTIATLVQNEARWLPEWLEYHLLPAIGVKHFYLYDDGSTDALADAMYAAAPSRCHLITSAAHSHACDSNLFARAQSTLSGTRDCAFGGLTAPIPGFREATQPTAVQQHA